MLERKAAMYDKLHQGTQVLEDDHLNQRFLVNFQVSACSDLFVLMCEVDEGCKSSGFPRQFVDIVLINKYQRFLST